jgi:IS30 family transposase
VDILPAVSEDTLTLKSDLQALLVLVDIVSRFTWLIFMPNKSARSVIASLSTFAAQVIVKSLDAHELL